MSKKTKKANGSASKSAPAKRSSKAAATDGTLTISRAIADPSRYALLRQIAGCSSKSCADMREATGMNAATLSHHIRQLEAAGIIETRRDGRTLRAELKRKAWKAYIGDLKAIAG